ncbi:hypothetical protein [Pseudomonas aeruginosa]|uniref:hypothetical protein n=1 Tax=Pseudomonas aeruginosa TaxID=287 RepID=UPI003968C602
MRLSFLLLTIALAGCNPAPEISIRADEWVCSKVARTDNAALMVAGKAVIPLRQSGMECVQWTRMGEQP